MKTLKKLTFLAVISLGAAFSARASCTYLLGNYSPNCNYEFTSVVSNNCNPNTSSTATIGVNQSGASYNLYPGGNTQIISQNLSGTTLTITFGLKFGYSGQIGFALHMAGADCNSNFVAVLID